MRVFIFSFMFIFFADVVFSKPVFEARLSFFDSVKTGIPARARLIVQNPYQVDISDLKMLEGKFLEDAYFFSKMEGPIKNPNNADVTVFDVELVATKRLNKEDVRFEGKRNIYTILVHNRIIRDDQAKTKGQVAYTHLSKGFFIQDVDKSKYYLLFFIGLVLTGFLIKLVLVMQKSSRTKRVEKLKKEQFIDEIKTSKTRSDYENIYRNKVRLLDMKECNISVANKMLKIINENQYKPSWDENTLNDLENVKKQVFL